MIYNVVLISAVPQSDSNIYIHTHTHTHICIYIYIIFNILSHGNKNYWTSKCRKMWLLKDSHH